MKEQLGLWVKACAAGVRRELGKPAPPSVSDEKMLQVNSMDMSIGMSIYIYIYIYIHIYIYIYIICIYIYIYIDIDRVHRHAPDLGK